MKITKNGQYRLMDQIGKTRVAKTSPSRDWLGLTIPHRLTRTVMINGMKIRISPSIGRWLTPETALPPHLIFVSFPQMTKASLKKNKIFPIW
jgi:hypothetical protein